MLINGKMKIDIVNWFGSNEPDKCENEDRTFAICLCSHAKIRSSKQRMKF